MTDTPRDDDHPGEDVTGGAGQVGSLTSALGDNWKSLVAPVLMPEPLLKSVVDSAKVIAAQQSFVASHIVSAITKQFAPVQESIRLFAEINLKAIRLPLPDPNWFSDTVFPKVDLGALTERFDSTALLGAQFFERQAELLESLKPVIADWRKWFLPRNLRDLDGLLLGDIQTVVLGDGIPLYAVPRGDIAEAIIRAEGMSGRRDIIGRRWKAIAADCAEAVNGCSSASVARFVPFVRAAVDALIAGHGEAAQALAGSLVETLVWEALGHNRKHYTPGRHAKAPDAYNELTVGEYIALAPTWRAYGSYRATDGGKIPTTFNRHAAAHTVSPRQYNRRNAVQGIMFACSLLVWLDDRAQRDES